MEFKELDIRGAWLVKPRIFSDDRGQFHENFKASALHDATGYHFEVKQVNQSESAAGVLRGIHWADVPPGQAKYVSCNTGSIIDFVVDLRLDSPTFGAWDSVVLTGDSSESVFISVGLGHAFLALEPNTKVTYLCSEPYSPTTERSINPFDETIDINFSKIISDHGINDLITSDKDLNAASLKDFIESGLLPKLS